MARILVLAPSGFGKSTSIGKIEELNIEGLNPSETFVISVTSKPLPFPKSNSLYKITTWDKLKEGNRIISNDPQIVANVIASLVASPFKNVVLDDTNYIMQDYFMENALSKGWDAPKKIGSDMNKIFKAIELYQVSNKNVIVLAHGESVTGNDGRTYIKMKTTGKMVDEYVTPEGKFDITLLGKSRYDSGLKKVVKEFITNEDEFFSSAKSPYGMFKQLYIPNDLGYVVSKVDEYYNA